LRKPLTRVFPTLATKLTSTLEISDHLTSSDQCPMPNAQCPMLNAFYKIYITGQ
jgi:hypothetical protein